MQLDACLAKALQRTKKPKENAFNHSYSTSLEKEVAAHIAHLYLCRPPPQDYASSSSLPCLYLDDVVQLRRNCSDNTPHTDLVAAPGRGETEPSTAAARQPLVPQLQHPWRSLVERLGLRAGGPQIDHVPSAAERRSASPPSAVEDKERASPSRPPPPYIEVHTPRKSYDAPQIGHSATIPPSSAPSPPAAREPIVERVVKIFHVCSHSVAGDSSGEILCSDAAAVTAAPPQAAVASETKKERCSRSRQTSPLRHDAPPQLQPNTVSTAAVREASSDASSSVAFAQRFLVEFETLSRQNLTIDYYATYPQLPLNLPSPPAAVEHASNAAIPRQMTLPPPPPPVLSGRKPRTKQPKTTRRDPASTSRRHCRVVFPGSLWDSVVHHHRQFLQNVLARDAEAALRGAAVEVGSLHTTPTELEVILLVKGSNSLCSDADTVLKSCPFGSVWEVYSFVSSVTSRNGDSQQLLSPPQQHSIHPGRLLRDRAFDQWIREDVEADSRRQNVVQPKAPPFPLPGPAIPDDVFAPTLVDGAPWLQTRHHTSSCVTAAADPQAELVVPILFATTVTNKLRRAARGGSNSGLHVALHRDGLYAVPSAQEVRVRAARVNADGLYVELVFSWQEGEALEENAVEAMNKAPFTYTWEFLNGCQPPTATNVLSTVVKREETVEEQQLQQQQQPLRSQLPVTTPSPLPPLQSTTRVDACTTTRAEVASPMQRPSALDTAIKVRSVMCEVPLTSPERRAVVVREPNAVRTTLKADIAQFTKEALAEAEVIIGNLKPSPDGSVSTGFQLDAVPEKGAHRVQAASFPQSFPHLERLWPTAVATTAASTVTNTEYPQRVTAGTSMLSLVTPANPVSRRVRNTDGDASTSRAPDKHTVTQMTQTVPQRPIRGSDSTAGEGFSIAEDAVPRTLVSAATQTSLAVLPSSSSSPAMSAPADETPLRGQHVQGAATMSVDSRVQSSERQHSPGPHAAGEEKVATALPPFLATEEVGSHTPATSFAGDLVCDPSVEERECASPVVVTVAKVPSYVQGSERGDISSPSLQITDVISSSKVVTEPENNVDQGVEAPLGGTRLSFSMPGERWGTLLEEYPVLLKRALQADMEDLFGVPVSAVEDVALTYDDRLHVVIQVDPNAPLRLPSAVLGAGNPAKSAPDFMLAVECLPHVWSLYEQRSRHHLAPASQSSLRARPLFSSSCPSRDSSMARRETTECGALLNASPNTASVSTVESMPSSASSPVARSVDRDNSSSSSGSGSNASRSGVVSTHHVQLPNTTWSSVLAAHRDEVTDAFTAAIKRLLGDQLPALSVESVAVEGDGRLRIDFGVPRSALPCGMKPSQFLWPLDQLPLPLLRHVHDDIATAQVPATLEVRRFFDVPATAEAALQADAVTLRSLFVTATYSPLGAAKSDVLRLDFSDHLVADVALRAPNKSNTEMWQQALMEHEYSAFTRFLAELTAAEPKPEPLQAAPAARRATLLSNSSLIVPAVATNAAEDGGITPSPSPEANHTTATASISDGRSSAHSVLLEGPLWPTLVTGHETELHEAVMFDAAAALLPLSVGVEQLRQAVQKGGVLLTFLLNGLTPENLGEVNAALQSCSFAHAKELYDRQQAELDEKAKAERAALSVYAMELDGEAWLEVLANHGRAMVDTFALQALACLRDNNVVTTPMGVAVREVVPKNAGVVLSYEVVTSAAADPVDRFRVAEAVKQHAFPLLWEMYDSVMLSCEVFKQTTNPRWVASRRQRLLNTTYEVAEALEPNPRSYTFIGYSNQEDLELYLQHSFPNNAAGATETKEPLPPLPSAVNVEGAAGQAEYDFKHLPAPSYLPSPPPLRSLATEPLPLRQLVTHDAVSPHEPPSALVATAVPLRTATPTPSQPPHASPLSQLPPVPLPEMNAVFPQQRLAAAAPAAVAEPRAIASPPHLQQQQQTPTKLPHPTSELLEQPSQSPPSSQRRRGRHHKKHRSPQKRQPEVDDSPRGLSVPLDASQGETASPAAHPEECLVASEEDNSREMEGVVEEPASEAEGMDEGEGAVVSTAVRTPPLPPLMINGPCVFSGALMWRPTRLPDVQHGPVPARGKSFIRIPAPPSRKRVEAPQSHPKKMASQQRSSAVKKKWELLRLNGSTVAYCDGEAGAAEPLARRRTEGRAARNSSSAASSSRRLPVSEVTTADQRFALYPPPVNRHSTAPITVMDVRMTHPPFAFPPAGAATDSNGAVRLPRLPAGVSLTSIPKLSAGHRSNRSDVAPRERASSSRVGEISVPPLPVLHATASLPPHSELTVPPTNRPPLSTPPSADLPESAVLTVHRPIATQPVTTMPPHWLFPFQPAGTTRSSRIASQQQHPSQSSPLPARVERLDSVDMYNDSVDAHLPWYTASLSSRSPLSPALPAPRGVNSPQPSPLTAVVKKVTSISAPDLMSDGPTVSRHSRVSPSLPQASLSQGCSETTQPRSAVAEGADNSSRSASGGSCGGATPQKHTDGTTYVAVEAEPNDRITSLWQDVSAVEQSVRTRYRHIEWELMGAANGVTASSPYA
jgi:hypothetical protein